MKLEELLIMMLCARLDYSGIFHVEIKKLPRNSIYFRTGFLLRDGLRTRLNSRCSSLTMKSTMKISREFSRTNDISVATGVTTLE